MRGNDLLHARRRIIESYDSMASSYDDAYRDARARAEDHVLKLSLGDALALVNDSGVLDLGCGTGHALTLIEEAGLIPRKYVGVDISRKMLKQLRVKHPDAFAVVSPMEDARLHFRSFDVVVSTFGALNHTPRLQRSVDNAAVSLIHGGRFVFQVYGRRWGDSASPCSSIPHRLFTLRQMKCICRLAGLVVDRAWSTGVALSRLPRRAPLGFLKAVAVAERAAGELLADAGRFLTIEGRRP